MSARSSASIPVIGKHNGFFHQKSGCAWVSTYICKKIALRYGVRKIKYANLVSLKQNKSTIMISRRSFIRYASAAAACSILGGIPALASDIVTPDPARAGSNLDKLIPLIDPYLDLVNPHTKDVVQVRFFRHNKYNIEGIREINHLMRDWRQHAEVQMDVRLYWALAAIRTAAIKDGLSGQIQINSGYRTKATNDYLRSKGYGVASKSFHMKARATDLVVKGGNVADVAAYARWLEVGGVGHYPGRFVHIDSGLVRTWQG
jgi:uncharacterized protein YcbK (DUF882 family)